jgi:hypothetical protein
VKNNRSRSGRRRKNRTIVLGIGFRGMTGYGMDMRRDQVFRLSLLLKGSKSPKRRGKILGYLSST